MHYTEHCFGDTLVHIYFHMVTILSFTVLQSFLMKLVYNYIKEWKRRQKTRAWNRGNAKSSLKIFILIQFSLILVYSFTKNFPRNEIGLLLLYKFWIALQISVHPIRSHFEFSRFPYTAEYFYKVKLSRENKKEIRTWKKNCSRLNRLFLILVTGIFIFYYLFELIEIISDQEYLYFAAP